MFVDEGLGKHNEKIEEFQFLTKRKRENEDFRVDSSSKIDETGFDITSYLATDDEESFDEILSLPILHKIPSTSPSNLPVEDDDHDPVVRKRENNRLYAQKSRMRKRVRLDKLREAVKLLKDENDQLKAVLNVYGIFYQGIPPLQL